MSTAGLCPHHKAVTSGLTWRGLCGRRTPAASCGYFLAVPTQRSQRKSAAIWGWSQGTSRSSVSPTARRAPCAERAAAGCEPTAAPLVRTQVYVKVEESIRGCDVFLIQPTSPPVNDHLMELLIMIDACRRASARSVTVVMPYFGYARADRKTSGRESITAKLVANLITEAGASCAPAPPVPLPPGPCDAQCNPNRC